MYSQLFNLLCTKADNSKGGKLNYHVRCLLDEFANIGEISQFEKLIATIRSREISASIILQAKSQLKAIYKDNADTIEGNCDTMLFLGGKEKSTLKEISESLGNAAYQWYYSKNAGATWIRVTNQGTSATYTTMASADRNGWLFRCKVTNSNKLEEISRAAKLEFDSLITKQPVDVTISETKNVSFTVEAKGNVTYQWYYRKGSSGSWIIVKNNGTSATYLTQGSKARNGWQFCCVVSDGTNRVTSDIANILFQA